MDVRALKTQVEAAMETLLRAADARVSWKPPPPSADSADAGDATKTAASALYSFLPGVYESRASNADPDAVDAVAAAESEHGSMQLLLHGDATFEYTWRLTRPAPRAMEYTVEMTGDWHKPVLNRSRRGDEDQRVFLTTRRIRFERLSNYDPETQAWKVCLKTLTRHGSDWARVGESERGLPPINLVFSCGADGVLESAGAAQPSHVLTNSPAGRVLAGLTKKIANKLGGPLDVMTDKWLPPRHCQLVASVAKRKHVKSFNPFFCLAEALRGDKQQLGPDQEATRQPEATSVA